VIRLDINKRGGELMRKHRVWTPEKLQQIKDAAKLLRTRFPVFFNYRPLKIGIRKDLQALDLMPGNLLDNVLSYHVNANYYQMKLANGGPRFDLDDNPVDQITEDASQFAQEILKYRKQKRAEQKTAAQQQAPSSESTAMPSEPDASPPSTATAISPERPASLPSETVVAVPPSESSLPSETVVAVPPPEPPLPSETVVAVPPPEPPLPSETAIPSSPKPPVVEKKRARRVKPKPPVVEKRSLRSKRKPPLVAQSIPKDKPLDPLPEPSASAPAAPKRRVLTLKRKG
jgi:sRNA-binding protein